MVVQEPVAQPVEHLTFNQRVSGSNPDGLTNNPNGFPSLGAKPLVAGGRSFRHFDSESCDSIAKRYWKERRGRSHYLAFGRQTLPAVNPTQRRNAR
jgi:hypothetical protein